MHTALLLEMAAEALADRPAMGPMAAPVSYGELWARARAAAAELALRSDDNVVHIGLNSPAVALAIFASGLLGRPFAPLNYRLPDEDLRRLLARTAPTTAVVDDDMTARVTGVPGVEILPRSVFEARALAGAAQDHDLPYVEPDIAVLLFTSGTTGEPKAAILRHRHLAAYVISTVEFADAEEGQASLVSVPPYHIAGVSAVLTGVYGGRRIVQLPAFTPEAWVEAAMTETITHAMVVPTMLGRILEVLEARGESLPHLQSLSYGGGRMPSSVIERALNRLPHVNFVNAYGLTETSSTIALLGPEDHRSAVASDAPEIQARLGSAGRLIPGIEAEVRDNEGVVLTTGQIGELWLRGEQVSGEYLSLSSPLDENGWFPTRDRAYFDLEGYLFIEGRSDDTIIRGGENIAPAEIEEVLVQHPTVAEAAVVGVPDDEWGQRIVAVVVPAAEASIDVDLLQEFARSQLRSSKTPDRIFVWAELPYTDTGKLLRREVIANLQPSEVG